VIFYSIIIIIASIIGFREDWAFNAPLCSLRAYCFNIAIATICYSKSIHAISRLFFAALYKHRYLLTWRVHWILIIFNWVIGIIVCIPPFFIDGGYAFEEESRSCVVTSKMYRLSLYMTIVSCIIPFTIIANVYILILFHAHRSTRRVRALQSNVSPNFPKTPNVIHQTKREMKIMKQMIIQTCTLLPGGPIFVLLIIWHATQNQPPPEPLYLLAFNLMTIAVFMVTTAQFIMSKKIMQFSIQYIFRHDLIHRQQQQV